MGFFSRKKSTSAFLPSLSTHNIASTSISGPTAASTSRSTSRSLSALGGRPSGTTGSAADRSEGSDSPGPPRLPPLDQAFQALPTSHILTPSQDAESARSPATSPPPRSPDSSGTASFPLPRLDAVEPAPSVSPALSKPFRRGSQRAHSDSATMANGTARPRPDFLNGQSSSTSLGGSTKSSPTAQAVTGRRPMSFLGFLGAGGSASRSSLLSATGSSKMLGNGKSVGKKAGKTYVTDAISVSSGPSKKGPSRVVAVVGNVRTGLGRMIVEELVRTKSIVVAMTDAHDGQFGKELEGLALSPSLFHAFPLPALFGPAFVPSEGGGIGRFGSGTAGGNPSSPATSTPTLSLGDSSSTPSLPPMGLPTPGSTSSFKLTRKGSVRDGSTEVLAGVGPISAATQAFNERHACLIELGNIFKSYRVDTVLTIFEPRDCLVTEKAAGGDAPAPAAGDLKEQSSVQAAGAVPPLPPALERARLDEMERLCLQAAIACGAGRFATCAWTPSLFATPLSTCPAEPPDHVRRAPLSATVFRWGVLMNELAAGVSPNEYGETALGKWLRPPSERSGRRVTDVRQGVCYLPDVSGKGKAAAGGVSLTLAEDVARFVALACKMKAEWDWSTGTMVGERIRGGWEEVVDMLDTSCRATFRREYVKLPAEDGTSAASSSDQLSVGGPNGMERHDSNDSSSAESGLGSHRHLRGGSPSGRVRSPADIDDVLRGQLAAEGLDASSVRLVEFLRVWFSPRPPSRHNSLVPPQHGRRAVRSQHGGGGPGVNGSGDGPHPRHHHRGGSGGAAERAQRSHHGPPPSRSSGAAHAGQVAMARGQSMPMVGQGRGSAPARGGHSNGRIQQPSSHSIAAVGRSPLAQSVA